MFDINNWVKKEIKLLPKMYFVKFCEALKASKYQCFKNYLYFISNFKQFFTRKILYIYIKQECIPKTKVT